MLKEKNKILESSLLYLIVILHEELHSLSKKDWILLFNPDFNNQANQMGINTLFSFKLTQMSHYFLQVLFLGI